MQGWDRASALASTSGVLLLVFQNAVSEAATPVAQTGKNLPAVQENQVQFLDGERRRKWQSTPVFLPGKCHGQRDLVGHRPWGSQRVRHD